MKGKNKGRFSQEEVDRVIFTQDAYRLSWLYVKKEAKKYYLPSLLLFASFEVWEDQ